MEHRGCGELKRDAIFGNFKVRQPTSRFSRSQYAPPPQPDARKKPRRNNKRRFLRRFLRCAAVSRHRQRLRRADAAAAVHATPSMCSSVCLQDARRATAATANARVSIFRPRSSPSAKPGSVPAGASLDPGLSDAQDPRRSHVREPLGDWAGPVWHWLPTGALLPLANEERFRDCRPAGSEIAAPGRLAAGPSQGQRAPSPRVLRHRKGTERPAHSRARKLGRRSVQAGDRRERARVQRRRSLHRKRDRHRQSHAAQRAQRAAARHVRVRAGVHGRLLQ
jgi:hypothetical protein